MVGESSKENRSKVSLTGMEDWKWTKKDVDRLVFDERGLIPAVVQDWRDGTVLMWGS